MSGGRDRTRSAADKAPVRDVWRGAIDHFNALLFDGALRPAVVTYRTHHGIGTFHPYFLRPENGSEWVELALNANVLAAATDERRLALLVRLLVFQAQWQAGTLGRRQWENRDYRARMEIVGMPVSHDVRGDGIRGHFVINPSGAFAQAARRWLATDAARDWRRLFAGTCDDTIALTPSYRARMRHPEASCEEQDRPQLLAPLGVMLRARYATKVAYRCPGCGIQVWGKPFLRVLCAPCDCPLQAHVPKPGPRRATDGRRRD